MPVGAELSTVNVLVDDPALPSVSFAVTFATLTSPLLAPPGTVTRTQTSAVAPGLTDGVDVSGDVHVASRNETAYVPPDEDIVYESAVKPRFLTWTV